MVRPSLFSCKPEILNECIDEERVYKFPLIQFPSHWEIIYWVQCSFIRAIFRIWRRLQLSTGCNAHLFLSLEATVCDHTARRCKCRIAITEWTLNLVYLLQPRQTLLYRRRQWCFMIKQHCARRVMIPVCNVSLDLNEHVNSMPARTQLALSCNEA